MKEPLLALVMTGMILGSARASLAKEDGSEELLPVNHAYLPRGADPVHVEFFVPKDADPLAAITRGGGKLLGVAVLPTDTTRDVKLELSDLAREKGFIKGVADINTYHKGFSPQALMWESKVSQQFQIFNKNKKHVATCYPDGPVLVFLEPGYTIKTIKEKVPDMKEEGACTQLNQPNVRNLQELREQRSAQDRYSRDQQNERGRRQHSHSGRGR